MRTKKTMLRSCLVTFVLLGMRTLDVYSQPSYTPPVAQQQEGKYTEANLDNDKLWHSETILSDLVYGTYGLTNDLQTATGANEEQLEAIKQIAQNVLLQFRTLYSDSQAIVTNDDLTFEEKKQKIEEMGYNQRVIATVNAADKAAKGILSPDQYEKFMGWTEQKYEQRKQFVEEMRHKQPPPDASKLPVIVLPPQK